MTENAAYPNLLSPHKIGGHTIKNRVWMAAHATLLVRDHLFTDEHVSYYVERAKGGVGMITMEAMAVHETTQPYKGKAFAFDPRMVPQYQKIADAVHPYGAKILAQPWHRGRQTNSVTSGVPVWAPSSIPCSVYREMPHVMSAGDIKEIIEGYRLCARHAREGGLDGIEVHGMSHGYLLNQFLSPATNNRTDNYGGSLENRLRIVEEILDATREEAGPDLIVGVRMNSDDGHEGGLGPDEWADIARAFEATGKIDYIGTSHGTYLNRMLIYPTAPQDHGYQMSATRQLKEAVSLPVVGAGRIVTPDEAEKYLAAGDCDFVALARALIADPEWVAKAERGEAKRVRPCVGANWCLSSIAAQAPIACIHNPAAGAETKFGVGTLVKTDKPKKVAVVGAGPAGLQAALTASRRGHQVSLYDARAAVGGQAAWWSTVPSRQELSGIISWLSDELAATDTNVVLNHKVDRAFLLGEGFESVVVATGSQGVTHGWSPLRPERWNGDALPGANLPHVYAYTAYLEARPKMGKRVAVVDSIGGRQGAVVAELLATSGHDVSFITQLGQPSPDLASSRDWGKSHGMLRRLGITFHVDREVTEITADQVHTRDVYTNETEVFGDIGGVVLVMGAVAEDQLFHEILPSRGDGLDIQLIGDALAPRRVSDAIREGEVAARAL
jgi:2,4-dienoyl-CoA reductase-like NADH-dependent reductase (Old Yellow Enzyme family)/thioredoxin reductase